MSITDHKTETRSIALANGEVLTEQRVVDAMIANNSIPDVPYIREVVSEMFDALECSLFA